MGLQPVTGQDRQVAEEWCRTIPLPASTGASDEHNHGKTWSTVNAGGARRRQPHPATSGGRPESGEVVPVRLLDRLLAPGAVLCGALALLMFDHPVPFRLLSPLPALCCAYLAFRLRLSHLEWFRQLREVQRNLMRERQLAQLNSAIIGSFAMAIDAKDQHSQGHTERVREIAQTIAAEMGLPEDDREALRMASMLHDVGKLAVPDYILSKPSELTPEEMRKVQTHALVGAALLESVEFPWPVLPTVRSHHEWYDGSGYPDGLAGEKIPLGARILAVADVYDALLSSRPYRPRCR